MVAHACNQSQLLGKLRQKNHLNLGGGGCGEPRSCHYTPAWATKAKLHLKKKKPKKQKKNAYYYYYFVIYLTYFKSLLTALLLLLILLQNIH